VIIGLRHHHSQYTNRRTAKCSRCRLFIFIGAEPHTDWLAQIIKRDVHGFVLTGSDLVQIGLQLPEGWELDRQPFLLETIIPGIFAAVDVRHGSIKRIAAGVGEGSTAIQLIHEYLK
jgi:thioredoxin reductase (NADPH)